MIQASDNSWNNTSLMSFVSGTQYVIYYGNDSISCCHNVTTKPISVKSLQIGAVTSYSVSMTWSKPDEYQTSYSYRVQTNVTSSATMINNTIVTSESATIMNLTPGETYTFLVYTRAADNSTESDPVSNTTCTVPGQVSTITMNNYQSVNVLGASWTKPSGKVDNYTVSLTGAITNTTQTTSPQVNFTGLLPGREYNVTVQTVSGSCSQTSAPVTEATYPTSPGTLSFITITAKNLTLSWLEPVNMAGVNKTYNISYGIFPSTNISVTSPTTNVTLQSLISGTSYSITVVTVGVRGYQSSPVTTSVYTKPMSVKSLQIGAVTSYSVSLTWSKPDEYQTSYSYRVQTNVTSSATMINDTIVTSESATIMNLTPGETYTFLVYTRAADNSTESDPVSNTTCTVPGQVSTITMNNYQSVNVLGASWTKPSGKVDNYTVSLTGAITNTTQTTSPQVNFTGLLPGREYNVTVQTVSGSCSQTSAPGTEATYPTAPGTLSFITITTKNLTLSWLEPVNMAGVNNTYNISYGISPSTNLSVTSPTTNVTLQSLISGSNYSITVVTVGVRGYQSSPVTTSVYTKPISVKSPQVSAVTSYSVSLTWSKPDEYQTSYSYRVQTNVTSSATMINNTIVTSESATIMNLTSGETYTFLVYTRAADNITLSDSMSNTTCTVPGQVSTITMNNYQSVNVLGASWTKPSGKVDNYTVSLTGAITNTTQTTSPQVNFTGLLPGREYNVTVQTVSGSCSQTSAPVTEATYPTSPGTLSFITITTKNLTLYWLEPVNMAGVNKTYNISYGIYPSTNICVTSPTTNVTLQSLISGSNYSITVVTVGVRGYQSSPVTTSVCTKPISVKSLQIGAVTSYSASLTWSKPDEYQTSYSYRVQTNVTSSATMINNTIVTSESATIMNLTPGETYTFLVYTRAADNSTESDPVSNTTCTVPGQVSTITMNNYQSVNVLGASWIKPSGKVDNYTVSLTGAITNTTQTANPQVNFTGLLPGREYNVTVQTVSGSCSQTSAPVTEATYPTSPGTLSFITITTKNLTLSWLEPVNMAGVNKSYNISYGISPSTNLSVTSPTTNVTLQSLISGSNYSITVVTVGVRGYQSSPVTTSVYTKPISVKSLQIGAVTSYSVPLTWSKPDEYQTSYSYRVQTNVTSSATMINDTIVTSESATIMNLTPGETYTFLVYTRAADNSTESDPMFITNCTVPGQVSTITMNNYQSVNVLGASWIKPSGKVDNYTVSLTGAITNTTQTTSPQVNFTGLLPGREYNVTVQTVSGSCSQTSAPGTEATYPTPPGTLSFITITTKNLTISWLEPVNMAGVNKSYNISYGISPSTNISVTSPTNVTTLQSLISGSNYSITVVTVGIRWYPSSPVTTSVYTKPMSVNSLVITNVSSYSVSMTWSKPDEYQTSYSYRVQTNVTSSATMINNTIVTSESVTIMNLTAGETYTFLVYTRAADNSTESDPVSLLPICTGAEQVSIISVVNNPSVSSLVVNWTPATAKAKVDYYNAVLSGVIQKVSNTTTQAIFTGLVPGTEYTAAVQIVSGNCNQTSPSLTEATYPTPPKNLTIGTIGTKNLTLSWLEPVNMSAVNKLYSINYWTSPSTNLSVTSPTTNVTLQSLISGSNYSITVVTVGVWGYQSSPVTTSVYTKPMSVNSLVITNVTSYSVSLTWSKPDEYQTSYSYRVQTNVTSSATMINNTIVTSESATIMNLTAGETYTFLVYTRAGDNITESDPVSLLPICTGAEQVSIISVVNNPSVSSLVVNWTPATAKAKVDYYNAVLSGVIQKVSNTTTQAIFTGLVPGTEYTAAVQIVSGNCNQTSPSLTEATYPTAPRNLTIGTFGTKNLTLSWLEPVNMAGVNKSYNISYGISPSTNLSVTSPTTNVTLQSLISGSNYSITVVTVGVRGYQSSPVTTSVYTKPMSVKSLQIGAVTSYSVSLTWSKPDEYQTSYSYRVQTNVTSSATMINDTIVTSESVTIMNLTPGETYTFLVYTRAADNSTESDPVSNTSCTIPLMVSSISLNNYKSFDVIGASWTKPSGKVDNYTVSLAGAITNTTQTTSPQVNFTGLLPGREYNVTVQTVSGSCSQTSAPVTEATYPTPPRILTCVTTQTSSLTLSWLEPENMSNVTDKSYNISYGIFPSSNLSVTSNTTNVTLQSLISGSNYSITVVTVGVRGYQSSPVTTSVYTKPMPVKSPQIGAVTSYSVPLTWSKPDEYQTSYSYRVQTNVTSSATMINDTIVTSESATIMNLTPGETYTFLVYTRAADNSTESDPVSNMTCTLPEKAVITVTSNMSTDTLYVTWIKPSGKVDNYTVSLTGAITNTTQTTSPQVNFTGLLPGREYNVTVQTVSGSCSQTSAPVTEATYPTPPRTLTISTVGTKNLTVTWLEPVNMTDVNKSYNISYWTSPSSNFSVTSPTTNVTLQSLISGTNYSITVVTVGVQGYQSSPMDLADCTNPEAVNNFSCAGQFNSTSLNFIWSCPGDLYTGFTIIATNNTSVSNNVSVSKCNPDPYSYTMKGLHFNTHYTVSLITLTSCSRSSTVLLMPCKTGIGSPLPDQNITVIRTTSTYYTFQLSFTDFESTNGDIDGYAIIVSPSNGNGKPSQNDLFKTYSDFKSKSTDAYVAKIIQENKSSRSSGRAATRTVTIGDETNDSPYKNGGLDPGSSYWVAFAGFTKLDRDTNGLISPESLYSITDYKGPYNTDDNKGKIAGAVVGSVLGATVIGLIVFSFVKMRRKGGKKKNPRVQLPSIKRSQTMSTSSFITHFDRQKADCNLGFSEEYEKLSSVGTKQAKLFSDKLENREKNRYTNVLPYDVSRVVLSSHEDPTEDYINANYIPGYNSPKEFIAAQGPLPRTVNDFWRMIWEKDVKAVIMLTKCVELGKVKCEEYWPQRSARIYGNLSISMNDENVLQDWTTRDFILVDMQTRQSKAVRHFHFTAWPDHGVPKATNVLIEFRNLVREYVTNDDSVRSPMVVHCSAGVGRTGTLIALDRVMQQIEAESQIDVYGVVYDLRMHRGLMVQTESQYIFLNQCALDIIKAPRLNDPDLIYQNMSAIYQNSSFKRTNL
ncbi:receptor-type tyrosine-protein phosphatase beta-like isoform X2 [Phyllobates terribilis]